MFTKIFYSFCWTVLSSRLYNLVFVHNNVHISSLTRALFDYFHQHDLCVLCCLRGLWGFRIQHWTNFGYQVCNLSFYAVCELWYFFSTPWLRRPRYVELRALSSVFKGVHDLCRVLNVFISITVYVWVLFCLWWSLQWWFDNPSSLLAFARRRWRELIVSNTNQIWAVCKSHLCAPSSNPQRLELIISQLVETITRFMQNI